MTVTDVRKDPEARTMTVTTEFTAPVERIWQLWADPRQLERWWGPPSYPATFTEHDLTPGATVRYHMTGPEGDQPQGYWRILEAEPPTRLRFDDGFADEQGRPNPEMPVMAMEVFLAARSGGTVMTIETTFASTEDMERVLTMGMEEGMREALGQIDALLLEPATS